MTSKEYSYRVVFYSMFAGLMLIIILALTSCDCIQRIPKQYIFFSDSSGIIVPDFTYAVPVRDSCTIVQWEQVPDPGSRISAPGPYLVTIFAKDQNGNISSVSFNLIAIDTLSTR